jgi:phospholipase/carboxylesterase
VIRASADAPAIDPLPVSLLQSTEHLDMTLQPLESIEIETGRSPSAAVIWMHGLGADGNDFVPIVNELDLKGAPDIRFVFPHAPMQPVSINNGSVMRAWYDVRWGDLEGKSKQADEKGVRASQAAIDALIAREASRGIARSRMVLAGFSQGGAIALQTALRHPEKLGGVMALSTYLPLAESFAQEAAEENKATAVFMAHGTQDGVVPYEMGLRSKEVLAQAGYSIEWHEYPMQHSVCLEEIAHVAQWLKRVLA